MKKTKKASIGKIAAAVLLLVFVIGPLTLYALLVLGWPPVIGNLTAAHAMRTYAAQVHPEWTAEGHWAGYNLEDGGYYLNFTAEGEGHSLRYDRDRSGGMVYDREREEALREELEIDRTIRRGGLAAADSRAVYWHAGWRPRNPETPYVTLRVDYYDKPDAPVLEDEAMREAMADQAMEVYGPLAPLAPPDRFSVHYCHQGSRGEGKRLIWNIITVDLPERTALTREQILAASLTVVK